MKKTNNYRELGKDISLRNFAPDQLLYLRKNHTCDLVLPEWLFDMDYPGQHNRRIKQARVSIQCTAMTGTTISCRLSLLNSKYRMNETLQFPSYTHEEHYKHLWQPVEAMVTGNAQEDNGFFRCRLHDEDYKPFENAGVIGKWRIELPAVYPQFDYETISDIILHIDYSAIDDGYLAGVATRYVQDALADVNNIGEGFKQLLDVKADFATAINSYITAYAGDNSVGLKLAVSASAFPYFTHDRQITITGWKFAIVPATALPAGSKLYLHYKQGGSIHELIVGMDTLSDKNVLPAFTIKGNSRLLKLTLKNTAGEPLNINDALKQLYLVALCSCSKDLYLAPDADDTDVWDGAVITEPEPLDTPVMTAVAGNGVVNVSWNAVPHATGYKIEKSAYANHSSSSVVTVTGTSTSLSGTSGQPLYFRIKALGDDDYADSFYSGWMSETPQSSGGNLAPTSNMAAWWKADNLVNHTGGIVDSWGDSSGNGNTMLNNDNNYKPSLVTSNGVPAVSFNEDLLATNKVISDTDSFTIFYAGSSSIGRGLDNDGAGWSISIQPKGLYPSSVVLIAGGGIGYTLDENIAINDNDIIAFRCSQNVANSTTTIAIFSRDGVKLEERTVSNHTLRSSGYGMLFGYIGSLNGPIDGVTYESIVYTRVLTDQEINDTLVYLGSRYNFLT